MSTLSESEERRVIAAVKKASSMVDDQGMTPNAAMTKIARENGWGVNMVKFAARAFNTGRQLSQMRGSATATEKYADFDLADADAIVAALAPARTAKVAEDTTASVGPMWIEPRKRAADVSVPFKAGDNFKTTERTLGHNGAWDTDVPYGANCMAKLSSDDGDLVGRLVALFGGEKQAYSNGLMDVYRLPDGKIRVNCGDWLEVKEAEIRKLSPSIVTENELGRPSAGEKLWPRDKSAQVEDHPGLEPGSVAQYNAHRAVSDIFAEDRRLKVALDEASTNLHTQHMKLANHLQLLADYMKGDGYSVPPRFGDVEYVCQTYLGKKAEVVLNWVATINNTPKEARASHGRGLAYRPTEMPYSAIHKCIKAAEDYLTAAATKEAADAALTDLVEKAARVLTPGKVTETWDLATGLTRTVSYDATKLAFMLPVRPPAPEPEPVKEAGIFENISPAVVTNGTRVLFDKAFDTAKSVSPTSGKAMRYLSAVSDPQQDAKIRQIRAMTDMSEIMNDPVISSEDPARVMNIYNDISRISPRSTEQPMLMKSQIRRHAQGQVEPFEVDNLLNTEKNLATAHPSAANVPDPAKTLTQFKGSKPATPAAGAAQK